MLVNLIHFMYLCICIFLYRLSLGAHSFFRSHSLLLFLSRSLPHSQVIVTMSHVSIEAEKIDLAVGEEQTQELARAIKEKYRGRKIIVGE